MLLDGIDVVSVKRPKRWEPPRAPGVAPAGDPDYFLDPFDHLQDSRREWIDTAVKS